MEENKINTMLLKYNKAHVKTFGRNTLPFKQQNITFCKHKNNDVQKKQKQIQ